MLKVNAGTPSAPDWRNIGCGGTAASGLTASDDFNRTSSTLGTTSVGGLAWTNTLGTWACNGTAAECVTRGALSGGGTVGLATVSPGYADGTVRATLAQGATVGGSPSGVAFRVSDAQNFFLAYISGLYRVQAGVFTLIQSWSLPNFSVVEVAMSGSTITVTGNGSTLVTTTQTFNQTATLHGLYGGLEGARLDDFSFTSPTSPATTGRLKLRLPDGTWVREKCDSDTVTARPLKMWDGTTWQTVACMVPA